MIRISELSLSPYLNEPEGLECLTKAAAKRLGVPASVILSLRLAKKSIDARRKDQVHFRCTVEVEVEGESKVLARCKDSKVAPAQPYRYRLPPSKPLAQRPVVVGFGPAGMFAALLLAQAGQCPIVVERGAPVEQRSQSVEHFWNTGELDPESNVQFGEGGAGTFSDGKLNTGTKDGRARKVLEELAKAGAPAEILYTAHPHIGTDHLPKTVRGIRETIQALGGEVRFHTRMTGLTQRDGRVTGVRLTQRGGATEMLETSHVVLAIGHSARDTYEHLHAMGIVLQPKPFSIGARVEHPQELIDRTQYGAFAGCPSLGAAEYRLAVHLENGRGVYTFCMCPGGTVVAAASEEGMVVTNGMSNFARDGRNANAALLVGISPEDFGSEHPLAGMELQRRLERAAFQLAGGTYAAPAQRVEDFLRGTASRQLGAVLPSYSRGVVPGDLANCLPSFAVESMRQGILAMERRLRGFAHPDAVLTGVETRSSAPVRVLRTETLESVSLAGLYPCGEGAGYAGGIVSAAVDGLKCAEQILHASLEDSAG